MLTLREICDEAGRRRTDLLSRTLFELLLDMMPILRLGKRARFQAGRVEAYIRKALPFLTVHLQSGPPAIPSAAVDSIYFTIGDPNGNSEVLNVEFSSLLVPEEWQFGLLKSGAALINLLRHWELDEALGAKSLQQPRTPGRLLNPGRIHKAEAL